MLAGSLGFDVSDPHLPELPLEVLPCNSTLPHPPEESESEPRLTDECFDAQTTANLASNLRLSSAQHWMRTQVHIPPLVYPLEDMPARPGTTDARPRGPTHPNQGLGPSTVPVAKPRRRRAWRRRTVGVSAGTAVLLAVTLLALAPSALGAGLGILLKHPYSGSTYDGLYPPSVGPGSCTGSGTSVLLKPTFNLNAGNGHGGLYSSAVPCTSFISEFAGITGYFGMNTSTFTPAASATNDHIKVRWTLDYTLAISMTDNKNLNSTAYAYAGVQLDAWLVDTTTSTTTGAGTIYENYTYVYDQNTTVAFTVGPTKVVEVIVADLTAGDTYLISTVVTLQTGAIVNGEVGTASGVGPSAAATAQLTFPADPAGAVLTSISY